MTTRTRKNHLVYAKYTEKAKGKDCNFCAFNSSNTEILEEFPLFWVVKNIFPYDLWDSSTVTEHLMLVPKRHVDSIGHFNTDEQKAYAELLANYEKTGYSIYARAPVNAMRSVTHQHSHLIKLEPKMKKFVFFLKKPRILITK